MQIVNNEDGPISIVRLGGFLSTTQPLPENALPQAAVLRNLSTLNYNLELAPGATTELPYPFVQDMQPQDVILNIKAVLRNAKSQIVQVEAYSGLVSIVEAPTNIFDPQMYVTPIALKQLQLANH